MPVQATPFGNITFPEKLSKKRRSAILRALAWCEQLAKESGVWTPQQSTHGERLVRTVNGHELAVFPMVAANLDAGCAAGGRFESRHLPVEVNGIRVCVAPQEGPGSVLHTDFVACFLLLCGSEEVPEKSLPHTLKRSLFPEKYWGRGHARFNPILDQRRRDVQAAFLTSVRVPEEAVEHALDTLNEEDWALLRDSFRWPFYPQAARAIAQRLLGEHDQRDENDIIWAMAQIGDGGEGVVLDMIRNLVATSNNPDIIRCALNQYPSTDAETAWDDLNGLLDHPIQTLGWAVHERLALFEELEERLIERSDMLLEDEPGAWLERKLVIWLSHRQNMDVWVRRILDELPQHELGHFLQRIRTYGSWFERWAKGKLSSPLEGVQIGIVEASKRNMSVNHGQLWLPLMRNGSGEVNRVVLFGMRDINDEDAYLLVDEVWHSPWRFVLRAAYMLVPHNFPEYPRMREMFEAGLRSPHARIRITAQKRLDAMDEASALANRS